LDIDTFKQKVFEDFDVELDEHSRLTELWSRIKSQKCKKWKLKSF
jgi:hypothetical protein